MPSKKAFGYIRVSTEEQATSGLGLEAQTEHIRRWCALKEMPLTLLRDAGVSGGVPLGQRPAGAKLISMARRSKGVIVVARLDRLFRSVADASNTIAAFGAEGVELVSIAEGFDMTSPYGRAMAQMASVFAELERAMISERTRAALAAYRARGGRLGTPANLSPAAAQNGRALGCAAQRESADQAYADLYPLLRECRAAGQTLAEIARHLNSEGYVTRRGRPWGKAGVRSVLIRADHLDK